MTVSQFSSINKHKARLVGQAASVTVSVIGKDVVGKPGDRVVLTCEGRRWVDKDGRMCDVKWDDRGRLYHYHTGCVGMFHLALVREPEIRCAYLAAARLRPARLIGKARPAPSRRRTRGGRPPLLLMR